MSMRRVGGPRDCPACSVSFTESQHVCMRDVVLWAVSHFRFSQIGRQGGGRKEKTERERERERERGGREWQGEAGGHRTQEEMK